MPHAAAPVGQTGLCCLPAPGIPSWVIDGPFSCCSAGMMMMMNWDFLLVLLGAGSCFLLSCGYPMDMGWIWWSPGVPWGLGATVGLEVLMNPWIWWSPGVQGSGGPHKSVDLMVPMSSKMWCSPGVQGSGPRSKVPVDLVVPMNPWIRGSGGHCDSKDLVVLMNLWM